MTALTGRPSAMPAVPALAPWAATYAYLDGMARDSPDWTGALCASSDPDMWHPRGGDWPSSLMAQQICLDCPLLEQCREYAIGHHDVSGIWGATTEKDRQRIRRERGITVAPVRRDLKPCGTVAAYRRHQRRRETPCAACTVAHVDARRAYDERRRRTA